MAKKDLMRGVVEQLNAAHHLNRLSDTHEDVFNFVAKVKYEGDEPTLKETSAAADWIDDAMRKRHETGKAKSERGRAASRENGRKGGRPKKA